MLSICAFTNGAHYHKAVGANKLVASNKIWFLGLSGVLLAIAGWMAFRPGQTCPSDPKLAALCNNARKWNKRLIFMSMAVWLTGFFAAYLAVPILELVG